MSLGELLDLKVGIETISDKSVLSIKISGQITSENIFALNNKMKGILEEGPFFCILDMSELHYINSSGISMVLSIQKAIKQNDGKLILIEPSSTIKDVLELTDLLSSFRVVPSVELAKKEFVSS